MNCPDCTSEITEEKNYLTDDEWTFILSCTNCTFEIETESNLVCEDRKQQFQERTSVLV